MVIDHLQNDKAALSSAALVDKSWLIRSRVHLFRAVSVTADFAGFAQFLHEKPHLRKYIEQLALQGQPLEYNSSSITTLQPFVLASILSQLPHLNRLSIHEISFHSSIPCFYLHPCQLDELTLINVGSNEDTTNDVLHILSLFSDVRSLNILGIGQCLDNNDLQARTDELDIPSSLRVMSLKIEDVPYELYMQIFRRTESVHTIKNIEMECGDLGDIEALAELLQDTSLSVESLNLNLTQCFITNASPEADSDAIPLLSMFPFPPCSQYH
ncbi:hypothetical protein BDY19DRAFT_615475 [Irpex rosettiformis]|uniref:Uncharacterized protein n=1 Tax=Irpex rosettiformis TaxID=378272 RepID=A0ACB8TP17_9APHY|nr:hypothetical protein BDY19DRAFT_615475 [Irpex rosettiformis]